MMVYDTCHSTRYGRYAVIRHSEAFSFVCPRLVNVSRAGMDWTILEVLLFRLDKLRKIPDLQVLRCLIIFIL